MLLAIILACDFFVLGLKVLCIMVRNSEKKVSQSYSKYKTFTKMVEKALDPANPTMVRSLGQNRNNVQETFVELCYDQEIYKNEVDDGEFNSKLEDDKDKFAYNDLWLETIEAEFYSLMDKADERLETLTGSSSSTITDETSSKSKIQEAKMVPILQSQLEAEQKALNDSVLSVKN